VEPKEKVSITPNEDTVFLFPIGGIALIDLSLWDDKEAINKKD
jgi:hypothetical protein